MDTDEAIVIMQSIKDGTFNHRNEAMEEALDASIAALEEKLAREEGEE